MAEHGDSGGGGGAGFLLVFFGGIVAFWFIAGAGEGPGIFGNYASSTATSTTDRSFSYEAPEQDIDINRDLAHVASEVETLRSEVQKAKLWGTVSPHAGTVTLRGGNTGSNDEDEEYLTLHNSSDTSVSITGWTLESYVTSERAHISLGARLARLGTQGAIALLPGESAIVTTGESPIGTSFMENRCTGYFEQYQDFYPALNRSCPYPQTEMEEYGDVALDDDRCYDFVATLPSCEVARAEAADARISASCEAFVEEELTYGGCVRNHAADENFESKTWRIFLEENGDLWRSEREIIRLLDSDGKTVDVYDY